MKILQLVIRRSDVKLKNINSVIIHYKKIWLCTISPLECGACTADPRSEEYYHTIVINILNNNNHLLYFRSLSPLIFINPLKEILLYTSFKNLNLYYNFTFHDLELILHHNLIFRMKNFKNFKDLNLSLFSQAFIMCCFCVFIMLCYFGL